MAQIQWVTTILTRPGSLTWGSMREQNVVDDNDLSNPH